MNSTIKTRIGVAAFFLLAGGIIFWFNYKNTRAYKAAHSNCNSSRTYLTYFMNQASYPQHAQLTERYCDSCKMIILNDREQFDSLKSYFKLYTRYYNDQWNDLISAIKDSGGLSYNILKPATIAEAKEVYRKCGASDTINFNNMVHGLVATEVLKDQKETGNCNALRNQLAQSVRQTNAIWSNIFIRVFMNTSY